MNFIPTEFLKYDTDGVLVPQFQLTYIRDTTNTSHNVSVKMCHEVHSMCWENQEL